MNELLLGPQNYSSVWKTQQRSVGPVEFGCCMHWPTFILFRTVRSDLPLVTASYTGANMLGVDQMIRDGALCYTYGFLHPSKLFFFLLLTRNKLFFLSGKGTQNFPPSYSPIFLPVLWLFVFYGLLNKLYFLSLCWTFFFSKKRNVAHPTYHLVGPLFREENLTLLPLFLTRPILLTSPTHVTSTCRPIYDKYTRFGFIGPPPPQWNWSSSHCQHLYSMFWFPIAYIYMLPIGLFLCILSHVQPLV